MWVTWHCARWGSSLRKEGNNDLYCIPIPTAHMTTSCLSMAFTRKLLASSITPCNDALCIQKYQYLYIYTARFAWPLRMMKYGCAQVDVWLHPLKHHQFILLHPLSWLETHVAVYPSLSYYLVHWLFHFFKCCLNTVLSSLRWFIGTIMFAIAVYQPEQKREDEYTLKDFGMSIGTRCPMKLIMFLDK
jgi:hypothetical protein